MGKKQKTSITEKRVRFQRIRSAHVCQRDEANLARRASGCGADANPGHTRLSGPQPRGLSSLENKRNDTGLRFVLQSPEQGNDGYVFWKDDRLAAIIDWNDPVVTHGLGHRVKYARLVQRKATSPQAAGADVQGYRHAVQLVLEGLPHHKPKHMVGTDTIGADLGPSTIALVPQRSQASLQVFCQDLVPDEKQVRRLHTQDGSTTSRCQSWQLR